MSASTSRDKTPIAVRCTQWEYCAVPSGLHMDMLAGKLTKSQVYTYYAMRVWGRTNGRVWRNRDDLARELDFKGRRPLLDHLKALVEAGWIDRSYEPPNLDHAYPLYVLTLRDAKRSTEDSCQCWFKCLCGKRRNRSTRRSDQGSDSRAQNDQCLKRSTPCVPLLKHPKETDVKVETFGEGFPAEVEIEGTGEGVISKTETRGETKTEDSSIEDSHAAPAPTSRTAMPDSDELPEKSDGYGDVTRYGDEPVKACRGRQPRTGPEDRFTGDGPPPKRKQNPNPTTPVPMHIKHGKPQWPPRANYHSGYDVTAKWIEEMKLRHPKFPTEIPSGEHVGQARHIFNQIRDPDNILAIIRLAIWDWEAIRETIETWYTANKEAPNPTHILKILDQLGVNLEHGVISPAHRRSVYVARWIDGTWIDPRAPRPKGPSLAEQARARREKIRDEERAKAYAEALEHEEARAKAFAKKRGLTG